MIPPSPSLLIADAGGRHGIVNRAEYLIDGFRVGYESGSGCACVCVEFAVRSSCKHTREVAGRLAAQGRIAEHLRQGGCEGVFQSRATPQGLESSHEVGAGRRRIFIVAHLITLVRARI
jgi:hypothetical protein